MIKKEGVLIIINLLNSLKDTAEKLEEAIKKRDNDSALGYKNEIIRIKKEIDKNI